MSGTAMTDGYDGFLPTYPAYHQPFWDSVREHAMRIQRCTSCGAFRFVPNEMCPRCHSGESTWEPVAGTGEVYTYTVVHRAPVPAYQRDAPYVLAYVTLPEGVRMMSRLEGTPPAEVHIGMPVELVYHDVTPDLTLYHFRARPGTEDAL